MIASTSNQKMKEIIQLQKKSRLRNQKGIFLVEGIRMAREIPKERLVQLYLTEEFYRKHKAEFPLCDGEAMKKAEFVAPNVFEHICDTKTPQGILAVVRQNTYAVEELLNVDACMDKALMKQPEKGCPDTKAAAAGRKAPLLLVLDNLQDPGNLGTIFRTSEAAGVTGIILSRDCVDIYNPKTIRSTMGAVFRQPFVYVEDILETVSVLKKNGIRTYAAHLEGGQMYDEEEYVNGTAFLIGNEGNGLRREVAEQADSWIKIPMEGQAESLNAAVAAAVLMYEALRQRRK